MITVADERKCRTIREALERGETHVMLDARQPGVSVPRQFAVQANLILKFSQRYGTPLELTDWGIVQPLDFGPERYEVRVPWSAVFAARCDAIGQGWSWPAPMDPPISTPFKRGGLRLVN